ncbi:hypothetical protein [Archangium lipolyticum]|uniref:hypothetical protein n=1 Tax=Archangium lipolyticum TaxID=2970465 RepID=UPI00214A3922|nr:hypothetical protein [Archangium lipolyticum]
MKLSLSVLLLACAPACIAQTVAPAPAPASATVRATIMMRDPAALEVSYQIPPSCAALDFRNDGMRAETIASLRSDWTAADECTVFDGRQIRRKNASCSTLRLRVPATNRSADRVYPWAYPVERGLYVHTSAYAITDSCGPVDWTFSVPGGTVVVDGVITAQQGARSAAAGGGDAMPTVLIQQAFTPGAVPRVHASASFGPQTLAVLNTTLDSIEGLLKAELPGLPFSRPFIVATPSDHSLTYWGDVANRTVMRLAFPPAPGPEQETLLHSFVTHEMAHLTQPTDWNDSWKEDEATIGEGGAEFLRVVTAARLGWFDRAGLRDELEKAVNSCLLAADGKSWKGMRNRGWGRNPYDCGLTFYAIGLSSKLVSTTPLLRVRDYHRKGKQGERTDFARELECGGAQACEPRWLPRLAGSETLESVLLDHARQPDSLLRPTTEWTQALVKPMAFRHLALLMRADCNGSVSMYHEAAAARIASGPTCGVLRADMVVTGAEGLPLFDNANAVKASVKACREQGKTVLGLRDGRSVTLACGASVSLPARLFSVDLEQAQALAR